MDDDEPLGTFHAIVAAVVLVGLAAVACGGVFLLVEGVIWLANGLT